MGHRQLAAVPFSARPRTFPQSRLAVVAQTVLATATSEHTLLVVQVPRSNCEPSHNSPARTALVAIVLHMDLFIIIRRSGLHYITCRFQVTQHSPTTNTIFLANRGAVFVEKSYLYIYLVQKFFLLVQFLNPLALSRK